MGGGWLRWAALGGPLLAATVAIPNTTFTGNATPTVCYLPACDAMNTTCTAFITAITLNVRVSYLPVNGTQCLTEGAAFCPIVDRFSALNLIPLGAEVSACGPMQIEFFTSANYSTTSALDSVMFTQDDVPQCAGLDNVTNSSRAYAEMLILNITLNKGLLNYNTNGTVPVLAGTGIQRTCDGSGVCLFDPTLPCIGGDNATGRNGLCARCLATAALPTGGVAAHPSIYVGYYGSDAAGSQLLSGSQNPINFQKYSLGGVYNILVTSTENYINKAVNFNWGSLLNTTLGALNLTLPDLQSLYTGVVDKLVGNNNGGVPPPPAPDSPSPSPDSPSPGPASLPSPTAAPTSSPRPSPSPDVTNSSAGAPTPSSPATSPPGA